MTPTHSARWSGLALTLTLLTLTPQNSTLRSAEAQGFACSSTAGTACASTDMQGRVYAPFGTGISTAKTTIMADGVCSCWKFSLPFALKESNRTGTEVVDTDADDTFRGAMYRADGTRLWTTTLVVTSAGAAQWVHSQNAVNIPPGDYWFCIANGQVGGSSTATLRATSNAAFRTQFASFTCAGGAAPASFTPPAIGSGWQINNNPPYIVLNSEG